MNCVKKTSGSCSGFYFLKSILNFWIRISTFLVGWNAVGTVSIVSSWGHVRGSIWGGISMTSRTHLSWPDMAHMNFNRQRVGPGINAICPWPTASWFNNMYLLNFWGKIFQVKMKRDKVWNGQDRNTNIPILQCTRPSLIPVLSDDYSIELIDPLNCPNWHFCCFTPSLYTSL